MDKRHTKFISVPKNIEAMYNSEYGEWNEDEHYIWYLNDYDVSALRETFDLMNEMFKVLIDDYEDDDILYQKLFFQKDELLHKIKSYSQSEVHGKLIKMIDKAIDARTLLSFHL